MSPSNDRLQQARMAYTRHQKHIILLVTILLCIYLIGYAAELTWRLLPAPEQTPVAGISTGNNAVKQNTNRVNINAIKALNLFGNAAAKPTPVVETVVADAPETTLSLTLTGVVASNQSQEGAAIIENRGKQNTYGLGDKIDGSNAIVKEVYADRIIIRNGARLETLMLDGHDFNKPVAAPTRAQTRPRTTAAKPRNGRVSRERPGLSREATSVVKNLRNEPSKFTDYIAVSPVRENGRIKGYRVSPGRDPSLFAAAGLKANDVITEINGLDMTNIQESMQAMAMLREAESMQLTIDRKGDELTLYLDLPSDNKKK